MPCETGRWPILVSCCTHRARQQGERGLGEWVHARLPQQHKARVWGRQVRGIAGQVRGIAGRAAGGESSRMMAAGGQSEEGLMLCTEGIGKIELDETMKFERPQMCEADEDRLVQDVLEQLAEEFAKFLDIETWHLLGPGTSGIRNVQEQVESSPSSPSYITSMSRGLIDVRHRPQFQPLRFWAVDRTDEHSTISEEPLDPGTKWAPAWAMGNMLRSFAKWLGPVNYPAPN